MDEDNYSSDALAVLSQKPTIIPVVFLKRHYPEELVSQVIALSTRNIERNVFGVCQFGQMRGKPFTQCLDKLSVLNWLRKDLKFGDFEPWRSLVEHMTSTTIGDQTIGSKLSIVMRFWGAIVREGNEGYWKQVMSTFEVKDYQSAPNQLEWVLWEDCMHLLVSNPAEQREFFEKMNHECVEMCGLHPAKICYGKYKGVNLMRLFMSDPQYVLRVCLNRDNTYFDVEAEFAVERLGEIGLFMNYAVYVLNAFLDHVIDFAKKTDMSKLGVSLSQGGRKFGRKL